ncbi:MucB/RseB C-terminal domain-containing protein [Arsukibacterium sp.]|uniref:MucB/RseB C-terminal domain-containing protein n=1 Tax=Arsukibacterium sp. TaxID=1977258 RepID=UPI002FDB6CDA
MRYCQTLWLLAFVMPAALASDAGWALFDRVQQSVRQQNFDTSFVVVKSGQVDTYRWQHGRDEQDEIEHLIPLDAEGVDILRRNNVVYYLLSDRPALVTQSANIKELPAVLFEDSQRIRQLYDAVPGSSSMMSGRSAQLLRLSANNADRFHYWLWVDEQTGFPLRIDTLTEQQTALERWVVTHMQLTPEFPEGLRRLLDIELPSPQPAASLELAAASNYQLTWLPQDYQLVPEPAEIPQLQPALINYWLLSDGLHQVSVFVQRNHSMPTQAYRDGATTIYVQSDAQREVTVIGPISIDTAQRLAASVR